MNVLPRETRVLIIQCLVEGMSVRSTSRITGCHVATVLKLLCDAGEVCEQHHDKLVRGLQRSPRIQVDEIWGFVYAKQRNVPKIAPHVPFAGDIWLWVALCTDSRLIITWCLGDRSGETAKELMLDLHGRVSRRIQLTTDGLAAYVEAVEAAFGCDIDYAMLVKEFGKAHPQSQGHDHKYSPSRCVGAFKSIVAGHPDPTSINTSYIERWNLTTRMTMRRYTRLTNGFSKKLENHAYAVALHAFYYNFVRLHESIKITPAMEAGITPRLWSIGDIVELVEENTPPPGPRGPYRKKTSEDSK